LRRQWSEVGSGCGWVGGKELALEWSAVIEASSRQID
jgi:hypothetical protein